MVINFVAWRKKRVTEPISFLNDKRVGSCMRLDKQRLRDRGWSGHEIKKTERMLLKAERKKHPLFRWLEKAVLWLLLGVTLLAIFSVAIVIWPASITLPSGALTGILVILGLALGSLYTLVVADIEWVEHHHHIAFALLLGGAALLTVAALITRYNRLGEALGTGVHHEPWLLSFFFALSLLLPYIAHLWNDARKGVRRQAG